jgi:AcrR family transcriptional regulator
MSQRHAMVEEDDHLLDAARACVLAVGVRRTTVTDVARRARVSRMTLYRRFPDLEGVLGALMTREFGRVVAQAAERAAAAEGATARERVVAMVVHGARSLAEDPLFVRLLDVDPELLLPYVTQRLGGMQKMAVAAGAQALAVPDGSVRTDVSPAVLSAAIELIARGFVLAAHSELEPELDPWAELGRAIDGYLRP